MAPGADGVSVFVIMYDLDNSAGLFVTGKPLHSSNHFQLLNNFLLQAVIFNCFGRTLVAAQW